MAHRLVLEARRRVDKLDAEADEAEERAEKAREALAGLDEAKALVVVTAVL